MLCGAVSRSNTTKALIIQIDTLHVPYKKAKNEIGE